MIGDDGGLPWHLPEDLRHFKALTLGHTLVMGRTTYESIGRPLPGRTTVVVTRNAGWDPGRAACSSRRASPEALALASAVDDEVFVVGGAQVYAAALPVADRLGAHARRRRAGGRHAVSRDRLGGVARAPPRAERRCGVRHVRAQVGSLSAMSGVRRGSHHRADGGDAGRARRARRAASGCRDRGDRDGARIRRSLRELRVPRCEERTGAARGADHEAAGADLVSRRRRPRHGRSRRARLDRRDRRRAGRRDGGDDLVRRAAGSRPTRRWGRR